MRLLAALAILPLLLAGCVSTGEGEPLEEAAAEAPAGLTLGMPQTQRFEGNLALAAGAASVYVFPTNVLDSIEFTATIPENATALVLELRWANAVNDLDLMLYDGDSPTLLDGGAVGSGDSPMKVVLAKGDFPTGDVLLRVVAKLSVAESFELAITPFEGVEPGDDFTGLA